ncbi:MAG: hydrogenase maturation protease [Chloroflexota bacterium]
MTLPAAGPLVVVGVGNILLRDDAIGVRVVDRLRALAEHDPVALPADTRLVDGGTLGLDLLRTVRGARGLVIIDAMALGDPVGTVTVRHGDAVVAAGSGRHGPNSIGELLAIARLMGWLPEPVSLVGIEVSEIDFGVELSAPIANALPAAVDAVRRELRRMDEQVAKDLVGDRAASRVTGATA